MIESLQNKHIKDAIKLYNKKYRNEFFITSNSKLILRAIKENKLYKLFFTGNKYSCDNKKYFKVSYEVMNKLNNNISDMCAVIENFQYSNDYKKRILILDNLQDPLNISKIINLCKCFNFDSVIMSQTCADIYNEKSIENINDLLFDININVCDIDEEIKHIKQIGFKTYAMCLQDNSIFLSDVDTQDKMCFILGNEGSGISQSIRFVSDFIVKIDMSNIDSLNVSQAASIVMYNFRV